MNRRELISLFGGTVIASRSLRAQQKATPVIGWLGISPLGPAAPYVVALRQGLSENGYVGGQNLAIEYRWAENHSERLPSLAGELVRSKVDLIVTAGGDPAALAAKNATSTIPIIRPRRRGHRMTERRHVVDRCGHNAAIDIPSACAAASKRLS